MPMQPDANLGPRAPVNHPNPHRDILGSHGWVATWLHYCKTTILQYTYTTSERLAHTLSCNFFLIFTSFYKYPNIYIWIQYTKNTFNMHFALLLLTHSSSVHIPSAAVWIFRVRRTLSSSQMDQAYKLPSVFFSQHTSAQLPYCVAH